MRRLAIALALLAGAGPGVGAGAARAQVQNETLLVAVPDGYKVDYRENKSRRMITEMVPSGQTAKDWTEMATVQIFQGMNATPEEFMTHIRVQWGQACPNAAAETLSTAAENGYPARVWSLTCSNNPQTGKPENTWFKAVQGRDSFYLVQKAFKFTPDEAQRQTWLQWLGKASVCDTRLPERPCPQPRN